MTDLGVDGRAPEFHIVVRRPGGRGPLGPYRLTLAVAFALVIAGNDLIAAAGSGLEIDRALIRAMVAAAFIWVLSGIVSRILGAGRPPAPPRPTDPATPS